MNFKTAFSSSALTVITATSTLAAGPAAQAGIAPSCQPFNNARCLAYKVSNPRFLCPREYRAVKPEYSPTREITCVRDSITPTPNRANIYNITNVSYGSSIRIPRGAFKMTPRHSDNRLNIWIERNIDGTNTFEEIRRDAGTIYLKDSNRNLNIELNLRRNQVILDGIFQRKVLYRILQAYYIVLPWDKRP